MVRPLRIEYPNTWYHVMNRGRRGEDIHINSNNNICEQAADVIVIFQNEELQMLGEVAEGIITFVIELIFRIIVEILCFYIGEIVLSVITLGKKRIRWDWYANESATKWMLLSDFSVMIGIVFWISVIVLFKKI